MIRLGFVWFTACAACVFGGVCYGQEDNPAAYNVEAHVYRILDDPNKPGGAWKDGSFAAEQVSVHQSGKDEQAISLMFMEKLDATIHGVKLEFKDGMFTWDGKAQPEHPLIKHVSSPSLTVLEGEKAEIRIGENEVDYFEAQSDGSYALRTLPKFVGFAFSCTLREASDEGMVSLDYARRLASVVDREELTETSLDVGKPRIATESLEGHVVVALDTWMCLFQPGLEDSTVVMWLRVTAANEG